MTHPFPAGGAAPGAAQPRAALAGPVDGRRSPHARLQPLAWGALRIGSGFWAERQALNRTVTLEHGYRMLVKHGYFNNLRLAAGQGHGQHQGYLFNDSDVYKWLEALGWELGRAADARLQAMADEAIALIVQAQEPDGYLNTYYRLVKPHERLQNLDHGHELYCAGHLFQAAVAFHRAVGDDRLLAAARRFADYLDGVFGPGKRAGACGHPEIEMALVELYRATGERRYLDLAQFFVDQRGQQRMAGWGNLGPDYLQDHLPVREVSEAVGHAVRQLYLTAGVTDLYLETGEAALLAAMQRVWQDVTGAKLYVTAGVGAQPHGEAFGEGYELPNDRCYCETCAAIANLLWNWRMLLATGEARFADLIERSLFNGILAGYAMDGRRFLYVNPLMLRDARRAKLSWEFPDGRPEWYACACCPPNLMRLFSSLEHYFATGDAGGVQIQQYAPATIALERDGGRVGLRMETGYPWDGAVRLTVESSPAAAWKLSLRQPGWARQVATRVNGQAVEAACSPAGYLEIERAWQPGDWVELALPVAPRLVKANPRVDATRGCLAIQAGPVVYCLEGRDQEAGLSLLDVRIDPAGRLERRLEGRAAGWELGELQIIEAAGWHVLPTGWGADLYRPLDDCPAETLRPVRLKAIPYYAWGNRGLETMRVWVPMR